MNALKDWARELWTGDAHSTFWNRGPAEKLMTVAGILGYCGLATFAVVVIRRLFGW